MPTDSVLDTLNRPLHDLRISVIDRCNFRCTYCMPEEEYSKHYTFLPKEKWLNFDEIFRLTQLFVKLGTQKVRITGGEPLLRPRIIDLIERLNTIKSIKDLALTTNGLLLKKYASDLKKSGLSRLTVSLDSLDDTTFKQMNGDKATPLQILEGINAAEKAGFDSLKVNVVVQKGVNDHTLFDLIEYFREKKHVLRFIEYMDVGNCNHWTSEYVLPTQALVKKIHERFPMIPVQNSYFGEVAQRYEFLDGKGEVGFVTSITQPFCRHCTRARLSTDGKVYTCLFAGTGTDLKHALRNGATDEELLDMIKNIWGKRKDKYSEERASQSKTKEEYHKVEMFQIGG